MTARSSLLRSTRAMVIATGLVTLVAAGCSSDTGDATTAAALPTAAGNSPDGSAGAATTTTWVPSGLGDDALIAVAEQALADAGEPVGADQAPLVRRGDVEVEISFPIRPDLPPRVGGEPHVHLDPATGAVLRITRTR